MPDARGISCCSSLAKNKKLKQNFCKETPPLAQGDRNWVVQGHRREKGKNYTGPEKKICTVVSSKCL
jgi:hypothetical protein